MEEIEHISDDGLTALCGESLIDLDPPIRPVCPACVARANQPSSWRALMSDARKALRRSGRIHVH
jgi:hypothetical protein